MTFYCKEQMVELFERARRDMKGDEYCMTFHQCATCVGFLTKEEFKQQITHFSSHNIICYETRTAEHNGKKYKVMFFQPKHTEENYQKVFEKYGVGQDPMVLLVFGIMIDAWCYVIPQ
jgi:hypothetical protein